MKLASFHAAGKDRFGFHVEGDFLVDLPAAMKSAGMADENIPRSMLELVEGGEGVLAAAREIAGRDLGRFERFAAKTVVWHPPVRNPSKICCLALNNSANKDRILKGPNHPVMFTKAANALLGHGGAIECRPEYGRTHPEPELAFVVSKLAKNIRAADAYDHVFGYTIHNDITSPTMRGEDTFHYRAIHPKAGEPGGIEYVDTWVSYPGRYKSADTFACMGPWIVTKDEIPNPHDLAVSCAHKGEIVTEDNTKNLKFYLPEVLEYLSRYATILPGDIVSMGTALQSSARGGAVQNIDLNKFGGPVSVTIERIGTLSNEVAHVV